MTENITINVRQPISDRMGSSIEVLLEVLQKTNEVIEKESITFDLTKLSFVHPFLILPIAALKRQLENTGKSVSFILPEVQSCKSYLERICFSEGLNPVTNTCWKETLNLYSGKTYLPIISVPLKSKDERKINEIVDLFEKLMQMQLSLDINLYTAIKYISGEAFDNIDQHANVDFGWIMAQNYPDKEYLDVCILDTGKGLLQSYIDAGFTDIKTHEEAMQQATNGKSTKIHEKTRGYGIRTSKSMLVEGLKGKYFLFSGNAFYIWTSEHKNISLLNNLCHWQGTMLALRIPKETPASFNYINFLE